MLLLFTSKIVHLFNQNQGFFLILFESQIHTVTRLKQSPCGHYERLYLVLVKLVRLFPGYNEHIHGYNEQKIVSLACIHKNINYKKY